MPLIDSIQALPGTDGNPSAMPVSFSGSRQPRSGPIFTGNAGKPMAMPRLVDRPSLSDKRDVAKNRPLILAELLAETGQQQCVFNPNTDLCSGHKNSNRYKQQQRRREQETGRQ